MIVTAGASGSVSLSQYLTPGSSVTYAELTAGPDGSFSTSTFRTSTDPTYKKIGLQQGSTGFVRVRHSDGNEVYTVHGQNMVVLENSSTMHGNTSSALSEQPEALRQYLLPDGDFTVHRARRYCDSMHVNQNENYLELYLYATRDLDWFSVPPQTVTVTPTPKQGSPATVYPTSDASRQGKTRVYITDALSQKVLIRAGDSILANFFEGVGATTRQVSLTMTSLPLITGSPDIDTSTVAGVGPQGWGGTALLNSPPSAKPVAIPPGSYTAYSPIRFYSPSNSPITLVPGYSGIVAFSDNAAHRIWAAWAVTSYQVKITGWLNPGDTRVCGKAPPGNAVRIHDVTTETQDIVIGTGGADSQGNFCVTVSPLYKGQVVMAESNGTFSQPVVVGGAFQLYLPYITH
ncbi:MAG: hypothetical protein M1343_10175 [Chloroflexi bacterium]|nr:hypothetical protein [Chloroflexota bacterium]